LMPHHMLEVLGYVPSSRLMIGSDLPESVEIEIAKTLTLDISGEDKRNILGQMRFHTFKKGRATPPPTS